MILIFVVCRIFLTCNARQCRVWRWTRRASEQEKLGPRPAPRSRARPERGPSPSTRAVSSGQPARRTRRSVRTLVFAKTVLASLSPLSLSVRAAAGRSHINLVQLQPVTSDNCRDMGHMMLRWSDTLGYLVRGVSPISTVGELWRPLMESEQEIRTPVKRRRMTMIQNAKMKQ